MGTSIPSGCTYASEDADAAAVLEEIGKLYAVEAKAREAKLDKEQRLELRKKESAPTMERIKECVLEIRGRVLPKSKLGEACDYTLNQWERLMVFVGNGEIEIDNKPLRELDPSTGHWTQELAAHRQPGGGSASRGDPVRV